MPSEALRQKYYAFLATFEHFEHVWRPDQLYKTSDKLNDARKQSTSNKNSDLTVCIYVSPINAT